MSRNAKSTDNDKFPTDSIVVLEESPRPRGPTYFESLQIFEDMHSADTE